METREPPLEVTVSSRNMPPWTRRGLFIGLLGGILAFYVALTWLVPPRDPFSTVLWILAVSAGTLLIGLYGGGFAIPTTMRIEGDRIRARQWRLSKEIEFAQLRRIYLFRDGKHQKLALVPVDGEVWYLGLGLSEGEFSAVVSRLEGVARARGIEFVRGVEFGDLFEREAREIPGSRK